MQMHFASKFQEYSNLYPGDFTRVYSLISLNDSILRYQTYADFSSEVQFGQRVALIAMFVKQ